MRGRRGSRVREIYFDEIGKGGIAGNANLKIDEGRDEGEGDRSRIDARSELDVRSDTMSDVEVRTDARPDDTEDMSDTVQNTI